MAYSMELAARVRHYLEQHPHYFVEEKKMFGGLAFLVNGKMCINVSRKGLMCRFDPQRRQELELRTGYIPMQMHGNTMSGFCYVAEEGYTGEQDFKFWMTLCLDFNAEAPVSKKAKPAKRKDSR